MTRFTTVALVLLLLATVTPAQGGSQLPPSPPPPAAVDQEQFVSYWTSETGWHSELQLRNNAVRQDVTVTPVLRLPNGTETPLAPVTIKPQEVKAIDLDAAIAAAAAPQLVGVYGSVVLRYRSPSLGSLYAAEMIRATGHAIAVHIDGTGESREFQVGSREGIWWLPNDTASDYLILTNEGGDTIPLTLSLYDAVGSESKQKLVLGPQEVMRYSVRKLVQAAHLKGSYGGIKISPASHAGSLNTLHFLFDETVGFSAILKMFDYRPEAKLEERIDPGTEVLTLRAPMLALTNPDPGLAFPPGTTLQPQLFIRNTTGKAIEAALRFNWRSGSSTGKALGPALHLNPFETRRIDIAAVQNAGTLPKGANWTSVMLTTNGLPDEIMAVAASYDKSLRYGAQTPFTDQLSFKWEGGMWEYDPYHSSIITAGNGGTKPATAAFTIFYNQGTQRYDLEQTLQPDEQMWIDVGKLIREHIADKNGKTLPADLTSGSYEFRDLTDHAIGSLFEGKVIYDKTYGHAAYGCANCCGTINTQLWVDPLPVLDGSTAGNGVNGYDNCALDWNNMSTYFYNNWSTHNTVIATVDYYGTHTGASVGSTYSSTYGTLREGSNALYCPRAKFTPSGGDNVMPTISGPTTVWFFGNLTVSGYATSIQLTSSGGSSTTWTVTSGANKINVSSYTGSSITVISPGTAFSSSVGDVKLTATANNVTSNPFSLTTRTPNSAVPGLINTACDGTYGYLTTLNYAVKDQMQAALPSGMPINEDFTTGIDVDYVGTNWRQSIPTGVNEPGSAFADLIGGENRALPPVPVPTCDGNSTPVEHWSQEWRVGSIASGFGRRIQTDTLQKYLGHAAHTSIVSPAP